MYLCRQNFYLIKMVYLRSVVVWMLKILLWGVIASIAWVAFSCEEFCEEPNRTAVVVNFYSFGNPTLTEKILKIKGVENDSALNSSHYFPQKDFLQVKLPVNPTSDFMSFSIQYDPFPADTLIIRYVRNVGFISSQCGCATFADIQEVEMQELPEGTNHIIRQVKMTNPSVTTVTYRQGFLNAENIKIYY